VHQLFVLHRFYQTPAGASVWIDALAGLGRRLMPCRCRQRWMALRDSLGFRQRFITSTMSSSGRSRRVRSSRTSASSSGESEMASGLGREVRSWVVLRPRQRRTVLRLTPELGGQFGLRGGAGLDIGAGLGRGGGVGVQGQAHEANRSRMCSTLRLTPTPLSQPCETKHASGDMLLRPMH
jgi:hypothetical protein